jgi:hypothetical protein
MSEMVLRLPSSYVEIERDEMEYVDGGRLGWLLEGAAGSILGTLIMQAFGIELAKGCAFRAVVAMGGWVYSTFVSSGALAFIAPYAAVIGMAAIVTVVGCYIVDHNMNL